MTVRIAVLPVAMTLAMAGLGGATARATPAPEASCAYTLTTPSIVTVSGTAMVTATLSHGPCAGPITPNSMTVCVEMRGAVRPQCEAPPTFDPLQVYFAPYRPGATYISTGRGCGNVRPFNDVSCTTLGPYATTL